MPTYDRTRRFDRDLENLDPAVRARFAMVVRERFVPAMREGPPYPPGLRIKPVQGTVGIWEMTFAPDGRATFEFDEEIEPGQAHIIWRRVGTHDIFAYP